MELLNFTVSIVQYIIRKVKDWSIVLAIKNGHLCSTPKLGPISSQKGNLMTRSQMKMCGKRSLVFPLSNDILNVPLQSVFSEV